jgi:hypothetical protein
MVVGTAVLAIAAMFATKANKKFTSITTAYVNGVNDAFVIVPAGILTATQTGLKTAYISLYTSTHKVFLTLMSQNSPATGNHPVYFK